MTEWWQEPIRTYYFNVFQWHILQILLAFSICCQSLSLVSMEKKKIRDRYLWIYQHVLFQSVANLSSNCWQTARWIHATLHRVHFVESSKKPLPEALVERIGFPTDGPLCDVVRPLVGRDARRGVAELRVQAANWSADATTRSTVAGSPLLPGWDCILKNGIRKAISGSSDIISPDMNPANSHAKRHAQTEAKEPGKNVVAIYRNRRP